MLIVLDSNPVNAANKVPDKLKFKQLLELAQMICSCGYSDIYKKNYYPHYLVINRIYLEVALNEK